MLASAANTQHLCCALACLHAVDQASSNENDRNTNWRVAQAGAAQRELHTYWEEAMGRIAKHVSALWVELSLPISHYFYPPKPCCQCFVNVGCDPASESVALAAACMRIATLCQ
jgi:hypothetical protein